MKIELTYKQMALVRSTLEEKRTERLAGLFKLAGITDSDEQMRIEKEYMAQDNQFTEEGVINAVLKEFEKLEDSCWKALEE